MRDGDRDRATYKFDPDWVLAPGETLKEWMELTGIKTTRILAAAAAPRDQLDQVAALFQQVLDKEPLTPDHAALLDRATGIPAQFWLALEHNYRVGLAAGKTDLSADG